MNNADISLLKKSKVRKQSGLFYLIGRFVREKPLGTLGAVITLLLLITGIFADLLAPYGMNQMHSDFLAAPSAKFWLGTDDIGRDLLTRILYGARVSTFVGLGASFLATIISILIGMISGYIGGKFDLVTQRFVDAWMSVPTLVILIVLISLVGPGIVQVIIVIGVSWGIGGSRIIRAPSINTREQVYVKAAISVGCSTPRILIRHILPNILAPVIILFTTRIPSVIVTEASLSFLGFGVPPPFPSWGGMLSGTSRSFMFQAPWIVLWPGLAISTVVYGVNMFGDALRDLLDPRLRSGGGRLGVRPKKRNKS